MAGTRKADGTGRGFIARGPARPGGPSRLANWPPPFRNGAEKPKILRYVTDEEREQGASRPTGFRITRGLLTHKDKDD